MLGLIPTNILVSLHAHLFVSLNWPYLKLWGCLLWERSAAWCAVLMPNLKWEWDHTGAVHQPNMHGHLNWNLQKKKGSQSITWTVCAICTYIARYSSYSLILYSRTISLGLNFAIFTLWSNLRNFYFTKCSTLKQYKADLKQNCRRFNQKIFHFGQITKFSFSKSSC